MCGIAGFIGFKDDSLIHRMNNKQSHRGPDFNSHYIDEEIFNLMDFDCEQRESVHFFYTLPIEKNKALVESTWLSKMNYDTQKDYDSQIKDYIKNHMCSNAT